MISIESGEEFVPLKGNRSVTRTHGERRRRIIFQSD